ncbi:MAG TPA: glycoside hydrolase family 48 protein [Planctomycetota bacterium]|nr:glycoside hydrolase family 48 protein [Planctomycetota bacterium]
MSAHDDLIQKRLHGLATGEDLKELDALLASSTEAADAFARASRLDHALQRHYQEERAVSTIQAQVRRVRQRRLLAFAAAALVVAAAGFFFTRSGPVLAMHGDVALHAGDLLKGPATITFPGEVTVFKLGNWSALTFEASDPGKRFYLSQGRLTASVDRQADPLVIRTPQANATVLGTRFVLSTAHDGTRLEVTHGKVRFTRGPEKVDVAAEEVADTRTPKLAALSIYEDRFDELYAQLQDPSRGYFSEDGIPYHSVETLIVDAPDQGHLTTSETFSYWLWLEAMHGRRTGDWAPFNAAWNKMEETLIPSAADQPTADLYDPKKPATYVPEADRIDQYPVAMDPAVAAGVDPLATRGGLHVMHWLMDVDDFYGYGKRALVNTFQRGPMESVWKTIPHPSKETFKAGGPNGFLDLFIKDASYAKQWRYTGAPDADARVLQAVAWAARWVREQGRDPAAVLPLAKAARMGDSLRYALHDKYFRGQHHLIAWSQAWGGSFDRKDGWAWRTGSSHAHFGYQNPVAAWYLSKDSPDWDASLSRQVEFYRWLQSSEGAIAGGATTSLNGRYEAFPPGTPTFHEMAYVDHPVFRDPPSNEWFGWQTWSVGRLAQYASLSGDKAAAAVVDKWAAWARKVVLFKPDGTYSIPAQLEWSGRPDSWDPVRPGANAGLHVKSVGGTADVGVAASLARALIAHGSAESRAVAKELLDRMWTQYRDSAGVSNPELRPDYTRFHDPVDLPPGWRGALASGGAITPGTTFLDLRPKYRSDPDFPKVEKAIRSGSPAEFRYHRFWAQVEVALACAEYAGLQ